MMGLRIHFAIYGCIASSDGASICWIGQAKWMALARDDVIKWIHVTDAYLAIFVMFFQLHSLQDLTGNIPAYV